MKPLISVLMGIYNCEETLPDAIQSIINQTYSNWELIMIDDGSTDGTAACAKTFASKDKRIYFYRNGKNCGLGYTLNQCLKHATGDYIARMDGDDHCSPDRFQKQIVFLMAHPEYAICSTPMLLFDETGNWGRTTLREFPTVEDVVTASPIHHAPVMMSREALLSVGGYTVSNETLRVEDVDLWIKLYAAGYRCCNLPEHLYSMRNDRNAFQRRKYKYRINSTMVRLHGCKMMGLGPKCYLKAMEPMIIGLIPEPVRRMIRKRRKR